MDTKQEILNQISDHLGIPRMLTSSGSTEPKEFLLAVSDQLGITSTVQGMDKVEIGKAIVEASGDLWLPEYDSTGATITKKGLLAIKNSVFNLIK